MPTQTQATKCAAARSGITRAEMKKIYRDFRNQPAQISQEQMMRIEEGVNSGGVSRRIILSTLTRSGRQLIAAFKGADAETAEVLADTGIAAETYTPKLRELSELSELTNTAHVRLEAWEVAQK